MENKRGYFRQLEDGKIVFKENPMGQFLIRYNEDKSCISFLSETASQERMTEFGLLKMLKEKSKINVIKYRRK